MKFSAKILLVAALLIAASCGKSNTSGKEDDSQRSVMILYSAGYNSLSSSLQKNIQELKEGWLPTNAKGQNVVLVVSKPRVGSYSNQTAPVLIRMYKSGQKIVMDTVKTYQTGKMLVDKESFRQILLDIGSLYPAKSYGMIFSSHATGWLPEGYYSNPEYYEQNSATGQFSRRSIGQEVYYKNNVSMSSEMEIEDMADALPYKLDYMLIDACFAGGVEVAYAFKDKVDIIGFSQAEVLSFGFDYTKMAETLLKNKTPEKVCKDFLDRYDAMTGSFHSATISVVNTKRMASLAAVCKELAAKYRAAIGSLDYNAVQPFFGGAKYWFFDLEDIFLKAGITDAEKSKLENALDECIVYKGTTGQYYSMIDGRTHEVNVFSGFSMYLPSVPGDYIRNYYKTLSWNDAIELVEK